ncbi:MAG: DUF2238 domain-containing protein [Candidatus Woesearchaeota archaeon]|nr:MAG: DUF2238 domain-containing protein [Candidatus Woesearchaeota archaeon]
MASVPHTKFTRSIIIGLGIYLFISAVISFANKKYEFLYYTVIMIIIYLFSFKRLDRMPLSHTSVIGISIVILMNLLGGFVFIGTTRLYDYWFIFGLLRYDHLMHFTSSIVATSIVFDLIHPLLKEFRQRTPILFYLTLVLLVAGLGALNEVVELGAVVFFDASQNVGTYLNNAVDLVVNFLGAICASIYLAVRRK